MIKEGRIVYCDRCGVSAFQSLNKTATEALGKPYYHDFPKGWYVYTDVHDAYHNLCPHCFALLKTIENRFLEGKSINMPAVESRKG